MKLSISIPAHNEENYIGKALESMPEDVEIVVVCNGCTDNTFKVVNAFSKEKNIKIFNLPEKGVSKARNYGAKMASGEKLVFMDADIVAGDGLLKSIAESEYTIGTCLVKPDVNKFVPKILMHLKNLVHRFGTCSGVIFCTKEIFDKVGGFDETLELGEDGKFLRAAKKIGKYGVVKKHAINSMRRFEKAGYRHICLFWVKRFFHPKEKRYEVIR
ncbi:MAG: glycosyltransferase family 2 protein [Nanoarchaeota archaeon]|nr:glycosyltransferase family 2 protein [Nanoarchaeota archaeon]